MTVTVGGVARSDQRLDESRNEARERYRGALLAVVYEILRRINRPTDGQSPTGGGVGKKEGVRPQRPASFKLQTSRFRSSRLRAGGTSKWLSIIRSSFTGGRQRRCCQICPSLLPKPPHVQRARSGRTTRVAKRCSCRRPIYSNASHVRTGLGVRAMPNCGATGWQVTGALSPRTQRQRGR